MGTVALLAVLGLFAFFLRTRSAHSAEDQDEEAKPAVHAKNPGGHAAVQLSAASQNELGIRTQILASQQQSPELVAYGRLEEDPSRSFVLRAPISGILHYASGRDWPSIGQNLANGAVIGMIEPRFTPAERVALYSQLATAESELASSTASASASQEAYNRTRILNADNKNVSDRALQDARSRLEGDQARLRAAQETVRQIKAALQSSDPTGTRPLVVERGGEVVELIAQPGESIEPGSPILRVARMNDLLARIQIPVGEHLPASVTSARVVPVGFGNQPIAATRVAATPAIDPRIQGEAFWFRLQGSRFGLRPGVAVTAYFSVPGERSTGVIVPQSAIVRYQGLGFAYIQTSADRFVRKQISFDHPNGNGFFTTENFHPGDRVVVAGAQSLLSEQLKSQIGEEE